MSVTMFFAPKKKQVNGDYSIDSRDELSKTKRSEEAGRLRSL